MSPDGDTVKPRLSPFANSRLKIKQEALWPPVVISGLFNPAVYVRCGKYASTGCLRPTLPDARSG